MKKSSKIIIGLSVVAGLLAVSEVCSAAPVLQSGKIFFVLDSSSSPRCSVPAPVSYTYMQASPQSKRVITLEHNSSYKGVVAVNLFMKDPATAVFVDSFSPLFDLEHPVHVLAAMTKGDKSSQGTWWQYKLGNNSQPCTGRAEINVL